LGLGLYVETTLHVARTTRALLSCNVGGEKFFEAQMDILPSTGADPAILVIPHFQAVVPQQGALEFMLKVPGFRSTRLLKKGVRLAPPATLASSPSELVQPGAR